MMNNFKYCCPIKITKEICLICVVTGLHPDTLTPVVYYIFRNKNEFEFHLKQLSLTGFVVTRILNLKTNEVKRSMKFHLTNSFSFFMQNGKIEELFNNNDL